MDWLKNIKLSLQATFGAAGRAAVLIAWMVCTTLLALYGSTYVAALACGSFIAFGPLLLRALASDAWGKDG